ncbi:MAG: hypothetical protein ABIV51_06890 [Saprospiraceae bacterium]
MNSGTATNVDLANGWRFIADRQVNFGVDRDVIVFGNLKDDFSQLKFIVKGAPLKIYDVKVYFDNGSVQDVAIRSLIRQGGESRVIDLEGGRRHLSKIEFWYETKGYRKGRATMAVWGNS